MKSILITIVSFLLISSGIYSFETSSSDLIEIEATLNNYIYGRNEGDVDRLKKAFHPTATLKYVDKQTREMKVWPSQDYINSQKAGEKKNCTGKIENINVFGDAAQATVIIKYPNVIYYDFISLLKIKGKWLIIDKVFSKETITK